jgi:hypothetical protein
VAPEIDLAEYNKSLGHLTEILTRMIVRAEELSTRRCPYRNRHDGCTAAFGCRNQVRPLTPGEPAVCAGDGELDY